MSKGSNFDILSHSSEKDLNPDAGNVSACLFKSVDWAVAKGLGSKRDHTTIDPEQQKGLEAIKGKTPSTKAFADMQAALGKNIYGGNYSDAAKAAGDAVIDRAISGEHPANANKRAQDASASAAHQTAATRTAEAGRPHEQHVASNPHTQSTPHVQRRTA